MKKVVKAKSKRGRATKLLFIVWFIIIIVWILSGCQINSYAMEKISDVSMISAKVEAILLKIQVFCLKTGLQYLRNSKIYMLIVFVHFDVYLWVGV